MRSPHRQHPNPRLAGPTALARSLIVTRLVGIPGGIFQSNACHLSQELLVHIATQAGPEDAGPERKAHDVAECLPISLDLDEDPLSN